MKKKKAIEQDLNYEVGSNNIFADLELENAEDELLKSDLTAEIYNLIKKKKLTQAQTGKNFRCRSTSNIFSAKRKI